MTLISGLVFRIIVSEAYLLYYLSFESQNWCVVASWDGRVSCTKFWVTVTLNYFLDLLCQEHIYYIILSKVSHIFVWMHLWMVICRGPFKVTVTLTHDQVSGIVMSSIYILIYYYLG